MVGMLKVATVWGGGGRGVDVAWCSGIQVQAKLDTQTTHALQQGHAQQKN